MIAKFVIVAIMAVAFVESGVVPAALPLPYAVAPYASSYNAHYVNHAIAAPVAAPLVAAPAFAAPVAAPLVAAHAPVFAHSAYAHAVPAAYPALLG